jgi:hypothetical protein
MRAPDPDHGAALPRRFYFPRRFLHGLGVAIAALLTWLVWRAYRQPEFLLDVANAFMLC